MTKINLTQKLTLFHEQWSPKIIGTANGQFIKLVKAQGEFEWHTHPDSDDVIYVVRGYLTIRFRDNAVTLNPGELYVVPKGVEHQLYAPEEVHLMLIEPKGMHHAAEALSEVTADSDKQDWI